VCPSTSSTGCGLERAAKVRPWAHLVARYLDDFTYRFSRRGLAETK